MYISSKLGPSLSSSGSVVNWMLGTSLHHGFVYLLCGPSVTRALNWFASPMLLGKRIMAIPGHVKDGLTNHCSLQPPNSYVLATFKLLLCILGILGAWFATASRWVTMCSLPVGISAYLRCMTSTSTATLGRRGLQVSRKDMMIRHGATKPACSPLPTDVFGSCKQAFNELRGSSSIPLLCVLETTWNSTRQWLYEIWAGSETWR